ncbi:hypothetical protein [Nocardia sp. NBC_00416]|uniref:hypothetical protein n=1 Tax=Nocardia sp. NBC_00416 TaxID=2975991 RepID=UPI002E1F4931
MDGERLDYGLGLHRVEVPGCGAFSISLTRADGNRQLSVALNPARWNELGPSGKPRPHPSDDALSAPRRYAICGN